MKNAFLSGTPVTTSVVVAGAFHRVTLRPIFGTRIGIIKQASTNPLLVGRLAMPRWPQHEERKAVRKKKALRFTAQDVTNVVYADAYELQRALSHALDRYETTEIPQLTQALELCTTLHQVVLGLRHDTYEELIRNIEALVDSVVRAIGMNVRDAEKQNALVQVVKTRSGTDSLNRVNSGVACLRMLTAVGNLIERESTAANISAVYASRRQAIRLLLAALETQVLIIEDFLNQILTHWNTVRLRRRELTMAQLKHFIFVLEPVTVRPFSATFQHIVREFTGAITCIQNQNLDGARSLLETSASSLRLRRLRVELERVHYTVASLEYNPALRKHSAEILQQANHDLRLHLDTLRGITTVHMVDFPCEVVLQTLTDAHAAVIEGNISAAVDAFRLALRAI